MKLLIGIAGLMALAVAVVAIVGALLPRAHQASRSVVIAAPPEDVYRTVADFANAPAWRADAKRVEILGRVNGRLRFKEHGAHGAVTYEVTEEKPPQMLTTEIIDRNLGYSGSWTYTFAPEGPGTRVTITEKGDVSNVIFRFMARFVFGYTRSMDAFLASMAEHFRRR